MSRAQNQNQNQNQNQDYKGIRDDSTTPMNFDDDLDLSLDDRAGEKEKEKEKNPVPTHTNNFLSDAGTPLLNLVTQPVPKPLPFKYKSVDEETPFFIEMKGLAEDDDKDDARGDYGYGARIEEVVNQMGEPRRRNLKDKELPAKSIEFYYAREGELRQIINNQRTKIEQEQKKLADEAQKEQAEETEAKKKGRLNLYYHKAKKKYQHVNREAYPLPLAVLAFIALLGGIIGVVVWFSRLHPATYTPQIGTDDNIDWLVGQNKKTWNRSTLLACIGTGQDFIWFIIGMVVASIIYRFFRAEDARQLALLGRKVDNLLQVNNGMIQLLNEAGNVNAELTEQLANQVAVSQKVQRRLLVVEERLGIQTPKAPEQKVDIGDKDSFDAKTNRDNVKGLSSRITYEFMQKQSSMSSSSLSSSSSSSSPASSSGSSSFRSVSIFANSSSGINSSSSSTFSTSGLTSSSGSLPKGSRGRTATTFAGVDTAGLNLQNSISHDFPAAGRGRGGIFPAPSSAVGRGSSSGIQNTQTLPLTGRGRGRGSNTSNKNSGGGRGLPVLKTP